MTANSQHPILICGPTASGKSALGMAIAKLTDGCIINADALQVYSRWRVLSARPDIADEQAAPHHLFGHVETTTQYSVGAWLRDVRHVLENTEHRPIIIGGTGLYFTALTKGLVEIPETPAAVRAKGDDIRHATNTQGFIEYLSAHDPETLSNIDQNNAMRLQRAWEVLQSTGRGLLDWQKDTPPPLCSLENSHAIVLNSNAKWLNARIETRFSQMMEQGAIEECKTAIAEGWDPSLPSSRALGAAEIIAYLRDETSQSEASERATIATRQFAKRQRTWFRSKMKAWQHIDIDTESDIEDLARRLIQNGSPT